MAMVKFTVDTTNKLFIAKAGVTTVDLAVDFYSDYKEHWLLGGQPMGFAPPMSSVGGQSIDPIAGTTVPLYLFLEDGWRIRPHEADHTLNVTDGILLVNGGGDPFVDTVGAFTVRVNYQQPVQAIAIATGASVIDWNDLFDLTDGVEGGKTLRQALRLVLSALAGKFSGAEGTSIAIRDTNDSKDRIVATVDEFGNRTSVTLDDS